MQIFGKKIILYLYTLNNLEQKLAQPKENKIEKEIRDMSPATGTSTAEKPLMPVWLYYYSNKNWADGIGFSTSYKLGFFL